MAYSNRLELKNHIGKIGIFYNDIQDYTVKIGKLISVTENGNCEDGDESYYDNFIPLTVEEIIDIVNSKFS
jgi:hypothetical protein